MIPDDIRGRLFDGLQEFARLLDAAQPSPGLADLRSEFARLSAELRALDAAPLPREATPAFLQDLIARVDTTIAQVEAEQQALTEAPPPPADDFVEWNENELGVELAREFGLEVPLPTPPAPPAPPAKKPPPPRPVAKPTRALLPAPEPDSFDTLDT